MRLIRDILIAGLLLSAQSAVAQNEIRAYQVPAEHQATLESVLGEAVSTALGHGTEQRELGVSSPGRGQLLITAPAEIHADIERFLQDFQPPETVNLRTEYWVVRGVPGSGGAPARELERIREVLESISATAGEMNYSIEAEAEILARANGKSATAALPNGSIFQELDYIGGKIVGAFWFAYEGSRLETEIAATPGDFIVLGRIGQSKADNGNASSTLFVILRSQIVD